MQNITFLIAAHSDPEHLRRLCRSLTPHTVVVHWDRKSGPHPEIDEVAFVDDPTAVHWGGWSQVEASVKLIRMGLVIDPAPIKLVLLSGACHPIRPIADLHRMFLDDGGHNYVNCVDIRRSAHLMGLASRFYFRDALAPAALRQLPGGRLAERIVRRVLEAAATAIWKRELPTFPLYHGSQWWALTPDAARYAVGRFDHDSELTTYYRHSLAADEQFFQTVIRNSPYADSCGPVLPDTGRGTYKTANLHLIDPSLSKWFTIDDLPAIEASDKFFVRKVSTAASGDLLTELDRRIGLSDD